MKIDGLTNYNSLFDLTQYDLPVKEVVPDLHTQLQKEKAVILSASPGAGKSTLLPLTLLEQDWLKGKKIIMLEPRRLAARSIAVRMSEMLGEEVGQTVGYRVRFDNKVSDNTRIEVVTEGVLTRRLQSDNALEGVGLVIFDEFHERSIHADLALALTRECQEVLRPDLKLLVMSATLDLVKLSQLLQAPIIESQGRQYPVSVHYTGQHDVKMMPELTARTVVQALKDHEGDVLVFLPGQGEILKTAELLKKQVSNVVITPLYGQLPFGKQQRAILPDKNGKRKVVLSTSIAETSLTIEGVKVVVDCGFSRVARFDANTGLSRLETIAITKDAADQRAGRAGRLSEGFCYRMWSQGTHQHLDDHRRPEIEDSDLASLVLDLAQWGVAEPENLKWLSVPPKGSVSQAKDLLEEIEATENGVITRHGKAVHRLPCHPRIAHMLLWAEDEGNLGLACDLAAILEERDPLGHEAGVDINLRIEALRRFRNGRGTVGKFKFIEKISSSYRSIFTLEEDNSSVDPFETGILLAQAFPERIACARPGNNAQFQLSNGKVASAHHKDDLAHEPWLSVASLNAREGMGKIFLASPLNPRDLAPMVKSVEVVQWDTKKGGLIASQDLRIGSIVLQSKPLREVDELKKSAAICKAIQKEGAHLLDFNEDVQQWQNRILSLREWNPDQSWPDVATSSLLDKIEDWLTPFLNSIRKTEDLKKINLLEVLSSSLSYEEQQQLDQLAPSRITVPSGSNLKIQYSEHATAPILSVRIQEVFGLLDTPKVNQGIQAMLLHLLSPGYKPVQVTSDLKNFWENTYFEVRKDLKGRYPKHHWPDDPANEKAIRGVKRKNKN